MEPTSDIVMTGSWFYGEVRRQLRFVTHTWDLAQHRAEFYTRRQLYPDYTDEQFSQEYVEEHLPTVNNDGENYQAELEMPGSVGRYFRWRIYLSLQEASVTSRSSRIG